MSQKEGRRAGGEEESGVTVMVIPESGGRSRTFRISGWVARSHRTLIGLALVVLVVLAASWVALAIRASRVGGLRAEVARLTTDNQRVDELARELATLEDAYAQIRGLFGVDGSPGSDELWLPPGTGRIGVREPSAPGVGAAPTEWPLAERGFVTRTPMTSGTTEDHPGIDIAVPSGVYVRAAGGGTVTEAGSDDVYGNYLVIDHGDGFRTLYGHASVLLASDGDTVRERQVIALTGSTGRSTAPHLHFEVLREGEALDPLSLVSQP